MMDRLTKLEAQVAALTQQLNQLKSSNVITIANDRATRERFKIDTLRTKIQIPTDSSNMTKEVSEDGIETYDLPNVGDEVGIITANDGVQYSIWLYNLP